MSNVVYNAVNRDYTLPLLRVGLYATSGYLAGRKAVQGLAAGAFALSAWTSDKLAAEGSAIEPKSWRQWFHVNADRFHDMAKKGLVRDLQKSFVCLGVGAATEWAEDKIALKLNAQETKIFVKNAYESADDTVFASLSTWQFKKARQAAWTNLIKLIPSASHPTNAHMRSPMNLIRKVRLFNPATPIAAPKVSSWCGPKCQAAWQNRYEAVKSTPSAVKNTFSEAPTFVASKAAETFSYLERHIPGLSSVHHSLAHLVSYVYKNTVERVI